jgi:hypothetical protein
MASTTVSHLYDTRNQLSLHPEVLVATTLKTHCLYVTATHCIGLPHDSYRCNRYCLVSHCIGFEQILKRAHLDGLLYLPPKDIVHFEKDSAAALQWCVAHKDRPAATATALPIKVSSSHEQSNEPFKVQVTYKELKTLAEQA